eukprot:TRINITY_DN2125_c0_g1_i13.p2 TRINITY_DN2125_c0_g1~~TRINITY_DN2125_c0_g1_i13.p2  ORF type:complete len:189 (-),score=28.09 TRINITY_DN2125_c0_g1_i13:212-733(-)
MRVMSARLVGSRLSSANYRRRPFLRVVRLGATPGEFSKEQLSKGLDQQVKRSSTKKSQKPKKTPKKQEKKMPEVTAPKPSDETVKTASKNVQKELQGRAQMMADDQASAAIQRQVSSKGEEESPAFEQAQNGTVESSIEETTSQTESSDGGQVLGGTLLPDGSVFYTAEDLQK